MHLSQNRKALPSVFGLLSCSSTFPPSVFPLSRFISPSPTATLSSSPPSPSPALQQLATCSFPFPPRVDLPFRFGCFSPVPFPSPPDRPRGARCLSVFLCRRHKGELWRYLTLQRDKCRAASALNSSQCCAVMQTSMRASREREGERGLSENV